MIVDLAEVADRAAIAILMTATLAWIHAQIARESDAAHAKRIVVCDEAWRVLSSEAGAEALLDASKHSRAYGIQPVTITHKISDLAASGEAGSRLSRIADGLLADAETRVVFAQPGDEIASARERLGLSDEEAELLPRLRRGEALWRIGTQRHVVRVELSAREAWICDTDQRMRHTPPSEAPRVSISRLLAGLAALAFAPVLLLAGATDRPERARRPSIGTGLGDIPSPRLALYMAAAERYGIDWALVAAIGKVECDHGRSTLAGCAPRGSVNAAGATGPMQFLAPTWRRGAPLGSVPAPGAPTTSTSEGYASDGDGDGIADVWGAADAITAAARMLAANDAARDERGAALAYNHSTGYADRVLAIAAGYRALAALAQRGLDARPRRLGAAVDRQRPTSTAAITPATHSTPRPSR